MQKTSPSAVASARDLWRAAITHANSVTHAPTLHTTASRQATHPQTPVVHPTWPSWWSHYTCAADYFTWRCKWQCRCVCTVCMDIFKFRRILPWCDIHLLKAGVFIIFIIICVLCLFVWLFSLSFDVPFQFFWFSSAADTKFLLFSAQCCSVSWYYLTYCFSLETLW